MPDPLITALKPSTVTVHSEVQLRVLGENFQDSCRLLIAGRVHDSRRINSTEVRAMLVLADTNDEIAKIVQIENSEDGTISNEFTLNFEVGA